MNLLKYAESFKNKMNTENFQKFLMFVKQSVDLNATNTSNRKCKDLAKTQINDLAERYLK